MKREDLVVGKLYRLKETIKNPNGDRRLKYGRWRDLPELPKGLFFSCQGWREVFDTNLNMAGSAPLDEAVAKAIEKNVDMEPHVVALLPKDDWFERIFLIDRVNMPLEPEETELAKLILDNLEPFEEDVRTMLTRRRFSDYEAKLFVFWLVESGKMEKAALEVLIEEFSKRFNEEDT